MMKQAMHTCPSIRIDFKIFPFQIAPLALSRRLQRGNQISLVLLRILAPILARVITLKTDTGGISVILPHMVAMALLLLIVCVCV